MKVIAISDLHGDFVDINPCDILLIAGDISPLEIQRNIPLMKEWMFGEFLDWIMKIPCEKVYLVAGNHDFWLFSASELDIIDLKRKSGYKLVYLKNESVIYHDDLGTPWKIYGNPLCHIFGNWPFMVNDYHMENVFQEIPIDTDIIISHDPPYGIGQIDKILASRRWSNINPESLGNKPLSERITKVNFKLLVCGHIHSGDHEPFKLNLSGDCVNVSIKDENYSINYLPFETELCKNESLKDA